MKKASLVGEALTWPDADLLAAIALAGGSSKPFLVGAAGLEPATNRL
jgi:hypothetical protein